MLFLSLSVPSDTLESSLRPVTLRCESQVNPIGVGIAQPRLSWKLEAVGRNSYNLSQTSYRIGVASSLDALRNGKLDMWDSGITRGDQTTDMLYRGKALEPNTQYWWKVQVADQNGAMSDWSKPATWATGLLHAPNFKAQWIGLDLPEQSGDLVLPPARFLRHEFNAAKSIRRATAYGSALGIFELHLNGKRIGDDVFSPGWTDYSRRVYIRAYDVTKFVKKGANAIGAILGDGWYAGYVGYGHKRNHYGKKIRAFVQLEIEYTDGTKDTVVSSSQWKAAVGPILSSDFLMGEEYDARRTLDNWASPGLQGGDWKPVDVGAEVNPVMQMAPSQPVRPYETLEAQSVTTSGPDTYVLNLGQNIAGFARLKITGKPGQAITLRFAERLNPDGSFYVTNLRGAKATDTYICRGDGTEIWEPKFTFHGFQYIEVKGLGHKPQPGQVVGVAVSSDTPNAGSITTSDEMLNQLVSNAWWTQRMNFIDVPTDCPQRDERLGWTGDAQAYIRTASMLTDVKPFFDKWLVDLDDAQRNDGQFPMVAPLKVAGGDGGPAWADAGVICPWTIWDVYGDIETLKRHYPAMKKFVEFSRGRTQAGLLPPKEFHCFGDWLNINDPTANEVIFTAYFAYSTQIVANAATQLGLKDDAQLYNALAADIRATFRKAYVKPDGKVGHGDKPDSQCGNVLALAFDLVDGDLAKKVAENLIRNIESRGTHLSTGFVGTRDIMHVLSKIGRNDVAFKLLHNKTFPSWGFTIVNGATSIWERWDGWTPEKGFQDPGMNSFAHYAFGAVVGWVMAQPAGITNLTPGFGKIKVAPKIDPNLTWLKSSYDSVRGKIVSEWAVKNGRLSMTVVVPPNVAAEIHVPVLSADAKVQANTELRVLRRSTSETVYQAGSGRYTFTTAWK